MFFPEEKFKCRVAELAARRWRDLQTIAPLEAMEDSDREAVHNAVPAHFEGRPFGVGDCFDGRDRYLWVRKKLTLPAAREGCEVAGVFDLGRTGGGYNSGFESLLYLDGHPYQAVDTNHMEVVFTPRAGETVTLTFLLWSGLEGRENLGSAMRHRFTRADIGYLDKGVDELFYLARAITETLCLLPEDATERYTLISALDGALNRIDWDADRFYATAPAALAALKESLAAAGKRSPVTVHTVGHTHIDVAWLWRYKHTREKAMRSFATVFKLMEEYPEYIFLQTQPQLYKFLRQDCPELYEKLKERVRSGQWEADGGMWLEADCNLTSGESLSRQFLHGCAFLKDELGVECRYLWLPDVFGYSWTLPQILKLCGIKTFMTTKISWNQYNSIPNDLFRWRGIDGSEVLTYFIETPGERQPFDERGATYNGMITAHSVVGTWKKFKNKDLTNDCLISYGYGDGGGGVTREMLEMRRALDQIPGIPNVVTGKAGDFFEKVHGDVAKTDAYVATWDGELYLEYHRGTYTSQARNKRANRKTEFRLGQAEWLSTLALLSGGTYDREALYEGWETVLRNQFHDVIPGSSIHEVYVDSLGQYAEVNRMLNGVEREAFGVLTRAEENAFTVANFSSLPRRSLVKIPESRPGRFTDGEGRPIASQRSGEGYLVAANPSPLALGEVRFVAGAQEASASPFALDSGAGTIETPFYTAVWEDSGALCRLYDKENGREVLSGAGNALRVYEDKPMNYDAWDIDIFYTRKPCETVRACGAPELVECGSVRAVLRFHYAYRNSTIEQDMIFYAGSRRIDFETRVDWHEDHRLLKTAFEVDIRATKASYDIQYGHVERPTHWNTSWDWARFEVCGHKWADLSETGYGVSLLNDCKYGYAVRDNVMTLSLLKSAKSPDREADMGEQVFTYALLPHAGGVTEGGTIEEGMALNLPLLAVAGGCPAAGRRVVYSSSDGVAVDAVKQAEKDGTIVVRLHECRGGRHQVRLGSDCGIKAFAPCDLLEREMGPWCDGGEIACTFTPFEIKTFKLRF